MSSLCIVFVFTLATILLSAIAVFGVRHFAPLFDIYFINGRISRE